MVPFVQLFSHNLRRSRLRLRLRLLHCSHRLPRHPQTSSTRTSRRRFQPFFES